MHTEELDRLNAALAGRYAIERELGSGGMATVYLAADLSAERNAAVDLPCEKPQSGSASRSSARAA